MVPAPASPPPAPRPPVVPDGLDDLDPGRLGAETVLEEVMIGAADLGGQRAAGLALRRVRLRGTILGSAELDGLELTDAELSGCDLANLGLGRHAGWLRVRARTCRLTGLTMRDGVLRDVTLEDCRVDLASFAGCRLQRVSFVDCLLAQTDFLEAELDGVRFERCDLTEADLRGARLHRCELRGCELTGLRGVERLKGAAMPWPDIVAAAGEWAQALGIEVLRDP